MGNIKRFLLD